MFVAIQDAPYCRSHCARDEVRWMHTDSVGLLHDLSANWHAAQQREGTEAMHGLSLREGSSGHVSLRKDQGCWEGDSEGNAIGS